ncbi:response regulator transcription factor [Paenibacillus sp. OSY-SE]|uniref:response regulator transcription factor n=1 Tax=Paenibacillus sp. OSY-SE TaxID=1196323 RepID=UPI0002D6DC3F|nr:response regulator [Paenibacillus sp. OSY-SE]
MKVLIVDDEEHVREGIELAIDWDKFGVKERYQAENGLEALNMIRLHRPGVLFCDMSMPEMDGVQLLDLIREDNPDMKIIVVSGYNDFMYTRATIKANGVDYILKPFKKKDLEQALLQAVTSWKQRENSLRIERDTEFLLQQADFLVIEQKMTQFLKGDTSHYSEIKSYLLKSRLPIEHIRAAVILMRNSTTLIEQRFNGDGELFAFALINMAHESMEGYGSHQLFRLDEYRWLLLTAEDANYSLTNKLNHFIKKVTTAWEATIGLEVLTGTSHGATDLQHIQLQLVSARTALLQCNISSISAKCDNAYTEPGLSNLEMLLNIALEDGNKAFVAELIHGFAEELRTCNTLLLKDLQMYTKEANYMLERASRQISKDTADLSIPLWISYIAEWETKTIQQWWRLIEDSGADGYEGRGIQAIHEYIQQHFHENVTLSALSATFHFSPQYIAKKFKEMYNTTVVTYQTDLRMEKAKSLLAHTDMPIIKIAELVGYSDENYFSKVFRKHQGLPPLKYRKQARDS